MRRFTIAKTTPAATTDTSTSGMSGHYTFDAHPCDMPVECEFLQIHHENHGNHYNYDHDW